MANKGKCSFCENEYQKRGMTRHLKACKARKEVIEGGLGTKSAELHGYYTIKVQDQWDDRFWMYVMVREDATLKLLDDFFRGIWLECCGHLSEFNIGYNTFISSKSEGGFMDDFNDYDMNIRLEDVLHEIVDFDYTYDFGESSHLNLNVMEYYGGLPMDGAIYLAARNLPVFEDAPNSPRVGMCGYDGDHGFDYRNLKVEDYEAYDFESDFYDEYYGDDDFEVMNSTMKKLVDSLDDETIERLGSMDEDQLREAFESSGLMDKFMDFMIDVTYKEGWAIQSTGIVDLLKGLNIGGLLGLSAYHEVELTETDEDSIIKAIADAIPVKALNSIRNLTTLQLKGLKKLCDGKVIDLFSQVFQMDFTQEMLVAAMYDMLLFTAVDKNDDEAFYCTIPDEFRALLKDCDWKELMKIGRRNDLWVSLAEGMLYYYGIMDIDDLVCEISRLTGHPVEKVELVRVLETDVLWKESFEISDTHITHWDLFDPEELLNEIEMFKHKNKGLEPRKLTKAEILKAQDEDYHEKTKAFKELKKYIMFYFETSSKEAEEDILDFLDDLDSDIKQEDIDDSIGLYIQNYEVINMDHANEMAQYVRNVYNSHRQWRLQGHSPDKVRKFADSKESKNTEESGNVYNIRTKKKIGRNDPCPCGSGKKYKKCCGR